MNFIGKLWNRFQSFPEYSALINDIDNIQKYQSEVINGLQNAFGSNLSEFAKTNTTEPFSSILLDIQNITNSQVKSYRKQLTSFGTFSADIKQIDSLHQNITKSRKELETLVDDYNSQRSHYVSSTKKSTNTYLTPSQRANLQTQHEKYSSQTNEMDSVIKSKKLEVQQLEIEYRKTVMQIVVSAMETYSASFSRLNSELTQSAANVEIKADQLSDFVDPSIDNLRQTLNYLINEEKEN